MMEGMSRRLAWITSASCTDSTLNCGARMSITRLTVTKGTPFSDDRSWRQSLKSQRTKNWRIQPRRMPPGLGIWKRNCRNEDGKKVDRAFGHKHSCNFSCFFVCMTRSNNAANFMFWYCFVGIETWFSIFSTSNYCKTNRHWISYHLNCNWSIILMNSFNEISRGTMNRVHTAQSVCVLMTGNSTANHWSRARVKAIFEKIWQLFVVKFQSKIIIFKSAQTEVRAYSN